MPLHFAAARHPARSPVAKALAGRSGRQPANENDDGPLIDEDTAAALRHFALHGLAAARIAHDRATAAHVAGDTREFESWIAICRALDWRLADKCLKLAAPSR